MHIDFNKLSAGILYFLLAFIVLLFSSVAAYDNLAAGAFIFVGINLFLVLIVLTGVKGVDLVLMAAVINLVFISFYFPLFGFVLGVVGATSDQLKLFVGVRPFVYSILLLALFLLAGLDQVQRGVLKVGSIKYMVFLFYLVFSILVSPAGWLSKGLYFFNSFFPLFLTVSALTWIACQTSDRRGEVLYSFSVLMLFFAAIYAIFIDDLYHIVRPDLISVMRSNTAEQLPYGEYPSSWWTSIGSLSFNRLVGFFPDPIIAGYFFSFLTIISWLKKHYFVFLVGLVLLFLSFSKGAWIYSFSFVIVYATLCLKSRLFWVVVLTIALVQIAVANMFHSSAYIHYLGFVGAIESVLMAPAKAIFGFGLGVGGNLEVFSGGGEDWSRAASLKTGAESGVGVIIYQLGFLGLLIYVWMINVLKNILYKRYLVSGEKEFLAIIAMVGSMVANSFLQENCINASLLGLLLYFCCVLGFSRVKRARGGVVYV